MAKHVRKGDQNAEVRLSPMLVTLRALLGLAILGGIFLLAQPEVSDTIWEQFKSRVLSGDSYATHGGITKGDAKLAQLFTPEVLYWREDLTRWAQQYHVNPNLLATIMQIESCGDPWISSNVGAQGLFQVMPFHFDNGENQLNPDTNTHNGVEHLVDCLQWTDYELEVALACYNGGPSVIGRPRSQWFTESQNYAYWGTGIYQDAAQGMEQSDILDEWLAAGGRNLCQQAQETQTVFAP